MMLFWTAVIALATIAYVVTSVRLLNINASTLKLTKSMFEATNRPFIAIGPIASHASGRSTRPELVFVHAKNVGNLPAKKIVAKINVLINKSNPQSSQFPCDEVILFPTTIEVFTVTFDNPDTMSAAFNSRLPIDVHVSVDYESVDQKKFTTNCHYHYNYTIEGFRIVDATWA